MDANNQNLTNAALQTSRTLPLRYAEFRLLVERFDLPGANRLSPLPGLIAQPSAAKPRPPEEVFKPVADWTAATARQALRPLLTPDRITDIYGGMFNAPPDRIRLYACRVVDHFVAIRQDSESGRELLFPVGIDHVSGWLEANLQFAGPLIQPSLFGEFTGRELAFLLALVDAYKTALFQAYGQRQAAPKPLLIQLEGVTGAARAGRDMTDRRFLLTALGEYFRQLVHIGGASAVGLPELDGAFIQTEMARYQAAGYLIPAGTAGGYTAGRGLAQLAADMSQWISILCLHDLQITGGSTQALEGYEEVLFYIPTQSTVWTLVSQGLTHARGDLADVRFGLRSSPISSALAFAEVFLEPAQNAAPPKDLYAGSIPLTSEPALTPEPAPPSQPDIPAPRSAQQSSTRFCIKCGIPVPADKTARYCRHCGQPLFQEPPRPGG